jgi:hypothetical protein
LRRFDHSQTNGRAALVRFNSDTLDYEYLQNLVNAYHLGHLWNETMREAMPDKHASDE